MSDEVTMYRICTYVISFNKSSVNDDDDNNNNNNIIMSMYN